MRIIVLIFVLLFSAAISLEAQHSIRKLDFKNFSYRISCGTADKVSLVRVRNGVYTGTKRAIDVYVKVYDVKYGDLNGDGRDDAVVLYACGSGASYVYFRGLVFATGKDRPRLLTQVEGGNKGDGGFYEVSIMKNRLIVERYQLPAAGSPCCPDSIETTRYILKGKRLVQVGRQSLRQVPPTN